MTFGDILTGLFDLVRRLFSAFGSLVEGEPWRQGDHVVFHRNNVRALAVAFELLAELMAEIADTNKSTVEFVDPA